MAVLGGRAGDDAGGVDDHVAPGEGAAQRRRVAGVDGDEAGAGRARQGERVQAAPARGVDDGLPEPPPAADDGQAGGHGYPISEGRRTGNSSLARS